MKESFPLAPLLPRTFCARELSAPRELSCTDLVLLGPHKTDALLGRPFGCLWPTLGVQNATQSCDSRVFDAPLSQSAFWTTLGTP